MLNKLIDIYDSSFFKGQILYIKEKNNIYSTIRINW